MKEIASADATLGSNNYSTVMATRGFTLKSDEPVSAGGANTGPTPYDYILAGLASCTLITLRMYSEHKGWELGELNATLSLSKDKEKNTYIHRTLTVSEPLSDEQWEKLLAIAAKTPVTLTLMQGSTITTEHTQR
ncbi:MAG TPA: OsmC family protein [Alcanivoracaceae bacterium]|nr:OsmC family protein [Alcanivoracaceae bacterium]